MNETQRKRRNKLIEWIINELTFDQSLSLSSFLNQQPFDDDAKRLQRDVMCTTQRLIKQELNHRIHNHTNVVPLPYPSGTVKIVFDPYLQDIFEKLHELNIQVNGTVSLQQLCGCPLVEIEHLDLCYNGIRSLDLFSDLAECKALKSLSLYQNKLSDINALRRVTGSQLETLHLVSNMVTNIEPLRGFSQLKKLYLEGNNISNIEPLTGLNELARLNLNHNKLKDIGALAGLKALTQLFLSRNMISDIHPLSGLNALTDLYLAQNNIENIAPLSTLDKLAWLDLNSNKIIDLHGLGGLKALHALELADNKISDIKPLMALKELRILRLRHTKVNASDIELLKSCFRFLGVF
eukprot:1090165_1